MTRGPGTLTVVGVVVGVVVGCGRSHNSAHAPSTPISHSAVDEATRLDRLVEQLYSVAKVQKAIPLAKRSLALREAMANLDLDEYRPSRRTSWVLLAPGRRHLDVATSLSNLAMLYLEEGAYVKTEPLLVRALGIREEVLGAMHPDVATSLRNLAKLHGARGAYTRAESLYIRALGISENALGAMHPIVALSLSNLAILYLKQGVYAKAEPLLVRALDIREKALGPVHPDVAASVNNLAALYDARGAYAKAEPLYIRALEIHEKTLTATHPDIALSLGNLAGLYKARGVYARAEPLYVRALDILEKALGAMHRDAAKVRDHLAAVYRAQGAYAKAEPLYLRALEIAEWAQGATHPEVVKALNNLAAVYRAQGAYTKAEPVLIRALAIHEKVLGPTHPDVAIGLNSIGALYQAQSAYTKAEAALARAAEIREAQLHLELARLSEPRKRALMMLVQRETDRVVSMHADAKHSSRQAAELAMTTVLRRKGRLFDALIDNRHSLRAYSTPGLHAKLDQLAVASIELSTRLRAPFDPKTAAGSASAITALRTRIDELDPELDEASVDFRMQSEPVTIAKVQAALPAGAALVEFVRFRRFDARSTDHPWQEERYVAYVLPWQGPLQWVALGEAVPIDAAVDTLLAAMNKGTSLDVTKATLQHLNTLVFGPLRGWLTNVSHVILSPDGKLNLVPFEALIDPEGQYEMGHRLVSYVSSGRDLRRLAMRHIPRSMATIIADPDYGPLRSPLLNGLGMLRPFDNITAEIAELPKYFVEVRTLVGDKATKAALADTVGAAMLHIATHGFYVRDVAAMLTSSNEATGPASVTSAPAAFYNPSSSRSSYVEDAPFSSFPPPPPSEDPTEALDRVGLTLAGANPGPEGVVSARELASYDWRGTQLVVLSARASGMRAVPSAEGVYGMRRALVVTGAGSQVISLWNVSGSSTRELMREFYGELARGSGRAEALRRAKLRLLRHPQFAHPYYWAAFVFAGDWTPVARHLLKSEEGQ